MKKEKQKILEEKYAGSFGGKRNKEQVVALKVTAGVKEKEKQANLFGDKDQIYNTIQTEISIIVSQIGTRQDSIDKQKVQIVVLQKRKDELEKAARSVAKMRDEELSKKKKEEKKK